MEPTHRSFRDWLNHELSHQGVKRRELARRLARRHPEGESFQTIETYRRAIYKYLDPSNPTSPNQQTRSAFAEALGVPVDSVPSEEEEEDESLSREQAELLDSMSLDEILAYKVKGHGRKVRVA